MWNFAILHHCEAFILAWDQHYFRKHQITYKLIMKNCLDSICGFNENSWCVKGGSLMTWNKLFFVWTIVSKQYRQKLLYFEKQFSMTSWTLHRNNFSDLRSEAEYSKAVFKYNFTVQVLIKDSANLTFFERFVTFCSFTLIFECTYFLEYPQSLFYEFSHFYQSYPFSYKLPHL